MKKRILVVSGSVGAVVLLLLMSFNSVAASNVNRQTINEEKRSGQFTTNFKLLSNYIQQRFSTGMQIDIFILFPVLSAIFGLFLYLTVWIYINIWLKL